MKKLFFILLLMSMASMSQAAVVLNSGDTYATSFNLASDGDYYKLTDNFWEVIVEVFDSDNSPFGSPITIPSTITFNLFENTDYTNPVFSMTEDTAYWLGDYGIVFAGFESFFTDHDGSLSITYNGPGSATLGAVIVSNFSGILAPSNVATSLILPDANDITPAPVPVPAAAWLFLSGAGLLGMLRRRSIQKS